MGIGPEKVYTVSRLNREIKEILEDHYGLVWIVGEVSNFRVPSSGHYYLTLKDEDSQIRAVMFRSQNRRLSFLPEDGMKVMGCGRLTVYEPRGEYQIILELLEPKGIGALQIAFEQLKNRLQEEGLFDEARKKPIPFLPGKIGVVTSPTGAAIHDFLTLVDRRFANIEVLIHPARVQGEGSAGEIVAGIDYFNHWKEVEVIVVMRGGGSLEDLWSFNEETVARAVFASEIPVISAVGHEVDYTIADFVADMRAPTPSAAAEVVIQRKDILVDSLQALKERLEYWRETYFTGQRERLGQLSSRLKDPRRQLDDWRLKTDDLSSRLYWSLSRFLSQQTRMLTQFSERLVVQDPRHQIERHRVKLQEGRERLLVSINYLLHGLRKEWEMQEKALQALDPGEVLKRGYSITRRLPDLRVVKTSQDVEEGGKLRIILGKGELISTVDEKRERLDGKIFDLVD